MSLLDVKHLSVAFPLEGKDCFAVHDVSFSLEKNEVLGIVGESGCGKSVMVQTILGVQHPKARILSGSVLFQGEELLGKTEEELSEYRGQELTMIFQEPNTALNPLMTIGKQIEEVLWIHSLAENRRKKQVLEMMQSVGLRDVESLYEAYPHELSGGMKQRVVIAMALVANPSVLIADEPTTALDATTQAQILRLFNRIKERYEGGILFISHDLEVVASICHRVMVMYAGRILEKGNAKDILEHPKHPYTEGLLRAMPNFRMRGKKLYNIPGSLPPLPERNFRGCPFAPRCEHTMPVCREFFPRTTKEGTREVSCHLFKEEARI